MISNSCYVYCMIHEAHPAPGAKNQHFYIENAMPNQGQVTRTDAPL